MELAAILDPYRDQVVSDPRTQRSATFKEQKHALNAIIACRTAACGEISVFCPHCRQISWFYHSCGNRSCPKCQHHETSRWLQRQLQKQLPVDYFLVTFTLPAELRNLARRYPKGVYNLLFSAASESLQQAAANPKYVGGHIGLTGVLHTHSRRLDFHPHVHFVVPGVAYRPQQGLCIHCRDRYLIPERILNRLFRGKFLDGLRQLALPFDTSLYKKDWVVDCLFSGKGDSALKYLSRYLYRGVISEKNILSHQDGEITFRYRDGQTNQWQTRTLPGVDFARTILQHTLPRGFRRVRDYGFLHGNAKKILGRMQLLLKSKLTDQKPTARPAFKCACCGKPAVIMAMGVFRSRFKTRIRSPPAVTVQAFSRVGRDATN
ncbi:transposase [bacterium]|nr:transposase [bacterium]